MACQTASQAVKGQERRDHMQLCMEQAHLGCLKQAIDQKIGPAAQGFREDLRELAGRFRLLRIRTPTASISAFGSKYDRYVCSGEWISISPQSIQSGIQAGRRVSSGPRPDCEVRVLSTTSRSTGCTGLSAVGTATSGPDDCSRSCAAGSALRAKPEAVVPYR